MADEYGTTLSSGAIQDGVPVTFGINDPRAIAIAETLGLEPDSATFRFTPEGDYDRKDRDGMVMTNTQLPDMVECTLEGAVTDPTLLASPAAHFLVDTDKLFKRKSIEMKEGNEAYQTASVTCRYNKRISEYELAQGS